MWSRVFVTILCCVRSFLLEAFNSVLRELQVWLIDTGIGANKKLNFMNNLINSKLINIIINNYISPTLMQIYIHNTSYHQMYEMVMSFKYTFRLYVVATGGRGRWTTLPCTRLSTYQIAWMTSSYSVQQLLIKTQKMTFFPRLRQCWSLLQQRSKKTFMFCKIICPLYDVCNCI